MITEQRLRRQRLVGERFTDPARAVSWFGAVQSQDFAGAVWGVGQRCAAVDEAGFRRMFDAGGIVRTHVLRPTWHFVAPADVRWMLALTAPRVHAVNAPYYRQGELDDAVLHASAELIAAALDGGRYLTRGELAEALARGGIVAQGLRLALIVMWCELEALICSGAMRGRQHTYALLADRVAAAAPRERDDALAELARRYFASHGPAQVQDFAWWSGLTVTQARLGVDLARADLTNQLVAGRTYVCAAGDGPPVRKIPQVHLLPNFDEYVVAYQDRSALFSSPALAAAFDGMAALASPLVLYRGRVVGRWKRTASRGRVLVSATMLHRPKGIGMAGQRALTSAIESYGRFVGLPVEVVCRSSGALHS